MQEACHIDDKAFVLNMYAEKSVRAAGLAICESLQIPWPASDASSMSNSSSARVDLVSHEFSM